MSTGLAAAANRREHFSFFRQSGWMVVATVVSGLLMSFVHNSAGRMPEDQYNLFTTMLDTLLLLLIPSAGVQAMFAQRTASAVSEAELRDVRAAVVGVLWATAGLCVGLGLGLGLMQEWLVRVWRTGGAGILWVTLAVGLVLLLYPVFTGVLQGQQNFFWLGNAAIVGGLGRWVGVTAAIGIIGGWALGGMAGVLAGALVALAVPVWAARSIWRVPKGGTFRLGSWVKALVPVVMAVGAGSVLLAFDTLFVRGVFGKEGLEYYAAAGRIGRALVMFTMPMSQVLFPKVARSAATGEPTAALRLALGATLGTGLLAALGCTLLPEVPLRVLYAGRPELWKAASLVPWFAWCMMPLTVAYTLVNHLVARGGLTWRRGAGIGLVALGYVVVLLLMKGMFRTLPVFDGFRAVLLTLGAFSLALTGVVVGLSRRPCAAAGTGERRA